MTSILTAVISMRTDGPSMFTDVPSMFTVVISMHNAGTTMLAVFTYTLGNLDHRPDHQPRASPLHILDTQSH